MVLLSVVVFTVLLAVSTGTDVDQCPGKSFENLHQNVQLMPCKRLPCRLKKGFDQHITITFTPDHDIDDVKNHVVADVFGVPLPFIGVDGRSVCDKLETESGEKASCPLKAGSKYVYKDSFPVLSIYPSLDLKIHWALLEGDKDLICFEVPAKIK